LLLSIQIRRGKSAPTWWNCWEQAYNIEVEHTRNWRNKITFVPDVSVDEFGPWDYVACLEIGIRMYDDMIMYKRIENIAEYSNNTE
jgi:hypothetical protein